MMLVDKEKVIEAIEETDWYHINKNGKLASGANSTDDIPLYKSDDIYKAVDSVKSVNAIPVEWIEKWVVKNCGYTSRMMFSWMFKDWEEESRKQDEAD